MLLKLMVEFSLQPGLLTLNHLSSLCSWPLRGLVSVGRSASVAAKEQRGDKGPFVFPHTAFAPPHTGQRFVLWDL